MKVSTIRRFYRGAVSIGSIGLGLGGTATFFHLSTHYEAYRERKLTAAAAEGLLVTAANVAKDLQKSGVDFDMSDLEIEDGKRKSTFRLVDGKVELVEETDVTKEEKRVDDASDDRN